MSEEVAVLAVSYGGLAHIGPRIFRDIAEFQDELADPKSFTADSFNTNRNLAKRPDMREYGDLEVLSISVNWVPKAWLEKLPPYPPCADLEHEDQRAAADAYRDYVMEYFGSRLVKNDTHRINSCRR